MLIGRARQVVAPLVRRPAGQVRSRPEDCLPFRGRRDGWVAEAQSARAPAEVARLLLELVEVMLWSAVDGSWRNVRPGWVADLSAVAGRAGLSAK